ncbi:hypothetical protein [Ligilactobacillus faecis]|uniref:hypothetical protein n=1 Tax=Ligilactobacillus faecis TaxID=762833 RepID=UPI00246895AE|nr:hypothetical protein [Ligilactobacillus faecis]WGN89708.1 hypothetical protein QFX10_01160 [Ligilactobacillus faecis]
MAEEKLNLWYKLIIFTSVPFTQLVSYFMLLTVRPQKELLYVQNKLALSSLQFLIFQILLVLLYSVISFGVIYLVCSLVLKLSKKGNNEALFIALSLALSLANTADLLALDLFQMTFVWSPILVQVGVGTFSYYELSARDRRGSIFLFLVMVLFGVGTLFFNM